VVNKDNDDIYTERLEVDAKEAQALIDKAMAVITSVEPPVGISTDPTWFECKFCDYQAVCHGTDVPAPTCRSCVHVTPEMDGQGRWSCASLGTDLTTDQQRKACSKHQYIPILLAKTASPVDVTENNGLVYKTPEGVEFINGDPAVSPDYISSAEIHACSDKVMLVDQQALELRKQHNGRFV
jgi:hypothetical protein